MRIVAAGALLLLLMLTAAVSAAADPYVVQVRDINPGPPDSQPQDLTAVGSTLYFVADDGVHGRELWKSDGTSSGTSLVADLVPGAVSSGPGQLTPVGDKLFFTASSSDQADADVYVTDGTTAGTQVVFSAPAADPSGPLVAFNGELFFTGYTSLHGYELWKTDGTLLGTTLVKDINPNAADSSPAGFEATKDTLYFRRK